MKNSVEQIQHEVFSNVTETSMNNIICFSKFCLICNLCWWESGYNMKAAREKNSLGKKRKGETVIPELRQL